MNIRHPRTALAAAAVTAAGLLLTGCGSSMNHDTMPGMDASSSQSPSHDMSDMPGMSSSGSMNSSDSMSGMPMAHGNGLNASSKGYTLQLKSSLMTGMAMPVRFVIAQNGTPVTDFQAEQTKKLHFYLIRNDLTGFQHLHPTMAADGTWSVTVPPVDPGKYRIYTQILPSTETEPIVLSVPVDVPGKTSAQPLPAPSKTTTADGYTVTLDGSASSGDQLRMSFAKNGKPVTDLQPYLDTYAHVTAFHQGDMAFTHLHPTNTVSSSGGGPDLDFMVEIPEPGTYRLFIQFMTGGKLHTAAITTEVS